MRYNIDTESTCRTVEELDAFKDHKPTQPLSRADIKALQRALTKAGWSSTFFNHSLSH